VSALSVEEKRTHAGFTQYERQLVRSIGGVHVYQDNASQRAAELKHRPFDAGIRPHTHAVAGMQSKGPQARCDTLRLVRVLRPSEPDVLVAADESHAFGKSIRSFEERCPYRFSDDGTLWPSGITLHRSSLHVAVAPLVTKLLYVQILDLSDCS
jgi:hypothetical protein